MEEIKLATFNPIFTEDDLAESIGEYYKTNNYTPSNPLMSKFISKTPSVTTQQDKFNPINLLKDIEYTSSQDKIFKRTDLTLPAGNFDKIIPSTKNFASVNSSKVIDFFKNKGLTPEQSAAIAGNFMIESSLNTGAVGDKHLATPSEGLGQWRGNRLAGLKAFAQSKGKDYRDLNTQLEFTWKELNSSENGALKALMQTKDVVSASRAFAHKYERMAKYSPDREKAAMDFLKKYKA